MTTVAYRDGTMAADSQVTGSHKSTCRKLHRINGMVVGFAGSLTEGQAFVNWLGGQSSKPEFKDDEFEALVLTSKGLFYWDSFLCPVKVEDKFTAIGSGAELAMGAMEMGADAETAIKVARKRDSNTGGRVRAARLR